MGRNPIRKLSRTNNNLQRRNQKLREALQACGVETMQRNPNTEHAPVRRNSTPDLRRHSRTAHRRASGRPSYGYDVIHDPMPNDRSEASSHALEVEVFTQPGFGAGTPAEIARLSRLFERMHYIRSLEHTQGPASARFTERLNALINEVRRRQEYQVELSRRFILRQGSRKDGAWIWWLPMRVREKRTRSWNVV